MSAPSTTTARPRVLLINPNTTISMTSDMQTKLRAHLGPAFALHATTARFGHPVIATRAAYAVAAEAALDAYARYEGEPPDALVLACFGDPGLEALREASLRPVIGLAEASFDAAARQGGPFAVLTVGPAWEAMLLERLTLHHAGPMCRRVLALDGTGLDIASRPAALIAELDRAAAMLVAEGCPTIILGGGALAGIAPRLRTRARFIDCLEAAAGAVVRLF